jgi:cysteine desulfurase
VDETTYLDWAATAPLCDEAAAAMRPYFVGGTGNLAVGGNANSLHSVGRTAFAAMEGARSAVSSCVGCRPDELFFTSGATEADNTAIIGMVKAAAEARRRKEGRGFAAHLITTTIEHDAVLEPARMLEGQGVRVTYLKPGADGFIPADDLRGAMQPSTVLVSVMMANNEVGSIQPVADMARIAHEGGALFHTDAVQALGKIPVSCRELGVDAASFSAHKVCGPKGIGALYLKRGTPCAPFMRGGGQEGGFRSGTQNVAGMVGFAAAVAGVRDERAARAERERQQALRDRLYASLAKFSCVRASVPCARGSESYLPNIVHVTVGGVESETIVLRMDKAGVCVSGGSACSSKSLAPNRVLTELGISRDRAQCALRISMGRYTTERDIERFEHAFAQLVKWARA